MRIERRAFLQLALWGLTSACDPASRRSAGPPACPPAPPTPSARPAPSAAPAAPFALHERTLTELATMMAQGEQTAVSLVTLYRGRVEALDDELGAVLELNPDAEAIAEALDTERKNKGARGPLHGIPILLKDNIATADRTETTAGSLALVGHRPKRDSTVAARLREAGAVLLGKANMSEWANFRGRHASSGWSSRGGQCHNPYAEARNPCGSSSGSAVATSANMCAAAVGTETQGSIVCPASTCGIVGLKPTLGLVSQAGIIPISPNFDTAGPMTRSVRDAALMLGAMQGFDSRDPGTAAAKPHAARDYTTSLREGALKGARIGVARKLFGFHPQTDALMAEALVALKEAGATLVDPIDLSVPKGLQAAILRVMLADLKPALEAYMAEVTGERKTLADIIAFNEDHAEAVLKHFGQDLLREAAKHERDARYQKDLLAIRKATRDDGIEAQVKAHRLDAIVAPTGSPAWLTDHLLGDHFVGGSATPAAMAGYPNLSVPAGFVGGLPVGLSFFGPAWSEPKLLALGYAFEQATHHRRPPRPS